MDIPSKLKKALFDKGWTQKKLCSELGITETGLKYTMDNNTWKLETLERISGTLGLPISYFISDDDSGIEEPASGQEKPSLKEQVFGKMAEDIGILRRFFEEEIREKNLEIREKNIQIAGLQRMLESVLGKSEGDSFEPTSNHQEIMGEAKRAYAKLGLSLVNAPALFSQHVPVVSK